MKVEIQYQTQYAYAEPVSFSPHVYRLFPKAERHLRVLDSQFQTNADATVNYRRDLFDNEIAQCFYPGNSVLLQASFRLELDIARKNAFGFLLASHALELPFTYLPTDLHILRPYCSDKPPIELPFWKRQARPRPTLQTLIELNDAIHEHLVYERREEGDPLPPAVLLDLGRGACRDFAVLLAEVLRGFGLAARLASGYLCEFGEAGKIAEGSLHAWTEVYLPGAGWVGMDPTNGTFCDHHHLTAAVGLMPADISPVLGNYYHSTRVPAQMTASLQIIPHGHF